MFKAIAAPGRAPSRRRNLVRLLVLCLFGKISPAQSSTQDLMQLNLEDLMNIEVTSVSKKEQKLSRVAAAIYVITADDILRSGANTIPDLLRMAPGVEVAQIDSSKWAISIRGFNGQYSTKLLVLIDGRTVFSPVFNGVFWDAQDVPLDDIERIEVIRGPGGTLWGDNAVNGVINVITKNASATQGGLITGVGGSYEHGYGAVRYGGSIGSGNAYRLVADGFDRDHFPTASGANGDDDWHMVHGGFRVDSTVSPRDSVTVEGDAYSGNAGEKTSLILSISPPVNGILSLRDRYSGGDLLSRWSHVFSPSSETSLQVYFDRTTRDDSTYGFGLDTFEIDFQHHVGWGERQDFVWGLGYQLNSETTLATARSSFTPADRNTELFSSFVQDEITVLPDRVYLSLGTKFEHNAYTGFELEPSVRMAWTAGERQTLWAAISRADRTPSLGNTSVRVDSEVLPGPNNLSTVIGYAGNPNEKSELDTSFEAGYRAILSTHVSLDSTVFFNHYGDLETTEPGSPQLVTDPAPAHLVVRGRFANLSYGETHGLETFVDWKLTPRWTLSPGYSFLTLHIHREAASGDFFNAPYNQGSVANQQAQLRSQVNLPRRWLWNTAAYFVGPLPALAVPSYTRVDSNLIWQTTKRFSLSLVGQNLVRDHHLEFTGPDSSVESDLVKRSAYLKVSWAF